jgi:trimethylamine--corrinoid protein Co-methyltransferase
MAAIKPIRRGFDLQVLTKQELTRIRTATLDVLERAGVSFPSKKALDILQEHGAQVDRETQIVRISADLVNEAMRKAPRTYQLAGRAEGTELLLDGNSSYFGTDGCGTETVDFETGGIRASTKDDVARMAQVSDYLSSIAFYWPMVSAQDYGWTAPLHELDASFGNTVKHVQSETAMGEGLARYAVRMAETIAGSTKEMRARPPLSVCVCTIAPLGQDREGIEAAMVYAEAGIPVGFMSMPTIGSTAPATTGGALVVGNAELVSAMVLMQLVKPGAPVFYSLCASVMEPWTADYVVGIPEKYLCNTVAVQLAHDWGVPALAGAFAMDCPEPATWRMGRDSVYTALMVSLAGADLAEGLGMVKASTLLVPEQIIFDDEIYHTHRVLAKGVGSDADGLALDQILDVGPRGHFLAQEHTRQHMREIWIPPLSHPRSIPGKEQSSDIRQRAKSRLDRILKEHRPRALEDAVRNELTEILNAAAAEFGE